MNQAQLWPSSQLALLLIGESTSSTLRVTVLFRGCFRLNLPQLLAELRFPEHTCTFPSTTLLYLGPVKLATTTCPFRLAARLRQSAKPSLGTGPPLDQLPRVARLSAASQHKDRRRGRNNQMQGCKEGERSQRQGGPMGRRLEEKGGQQQTLYPHSQLQEEAGGRRLKGKQQQALHPHSQASRPYSLACPPTSSGLCTSREWMMRGMTGCLN